jgi:hypothetical protein
MPGQNTYFFMCRMHRALVTAAALLAFASLVAGQAVDSPIRVGTAEELQEAIDSGAANVVVTAHLDIRGLQPSKKSIENGGNLLLWVNNAQHIQVRYFYPQCFIFWCYVFSLLSRLAMLLSHVDA